MLSAEHTREFISVDSSWPEHVERCLSIIQALEKAATWQPKDKDVLEGRLLAIDALLTGLEYPSDDEGNYEYLSMLRHQSGALGLRPRSSPSR